jgi:hypothetical protein
MHASTDRHAFCEIRDCWRTYDLSMARCLNLLAAECNTNGTQTTDELQRLVSNGIETKKLVDATPLFKHNPAVQTKS